MIILSKKRFGIISTILLISLFVFVFQVASSKQTVQTVSLPVSNKVIVLDAGHGKPDEGAQSSNGTTEAETNLKITLKVQSLLEQSGATVVLTRSDENAIYDLDKTTLRQKKISDIHNRVKIGNESSADIFVSIHLNKISQQQYYGWQCFYKQNDEKSTALAKSLQENLNDSIQKENKNYYLKKGYKLYEKVGISGLEREYEEYLKGTNAKYKVNNDNSLTLISHGKKGSDLYLSIDINLVNEINTIIKEELVKAKKHLNTQYLNDAFVIVGNPKTSEVYSLNGQRYLNDNTFTDISLNNINSAFTMGSVVKGATISVGYKYNLIEKGKKILDGCVKLKNKTEKCSFKELGYLDDVSALKMSSNYYQFLIAISLLGKKYTPNMDLDASEKEFNIYRDMLSSYGLGIITGIDLPNEKPGLKGNIISDDLLLNLAIGQYDTYTPIELFNYINTLAMKGKRISPSLVNEIKNNDFIIYKNKHEVVDNVQISNDDFNQIHKGFYEVMNNGTGLGFMNKNLSPAGKTGTSESFIDTNNDGKIDTKTLTLTMAGFFPYDDPKVSLIVVCPNTSHNNGKNKDYIYYLTSKISRRITNSFNEQKNSFN